MELGRRNTVGRVRNLDEGAHASAGDDDRSASSTDNPHTEYQRQGTAIGGEQRCVP